MNAQPEPQRASGINHVAYCCRDAEQTRWFYEDVLGLPLVAWQARIKAAGVSCLGAADHGFVKSVYMYDPNGLQVELTCRGPGYDETLGDRAAALASLEGWSRRVRALKERKFGAGAIDRRRRRPASRPDAAAKPQ